MLDIKKPTARINKPTNCGQVLEEFRAGEIQRGRLRWEPYGDATVDFRRKRIP
jgi:hypothetical protein